MTPFYKNLLDKLSCCSFKPEGHCPSNDPREKLFDSKNKKNGDLIWVIITPTRNRKPQGGSFLLCKETGGVVHSPESAGMELLLREEKLRHLLEFTVHFFEGLLASGAETLLA